MAAIFHPLVLVLLNGLEACVERLFKLHTRFATLAATLTVMAED